MVMEEMEEAIELRALNSLGLGFDLTSDFRLKFAKRGGGRLVVVDEENRRDIVVVPGGSVIRGVSKDIRCDKGDRIRFKSDVLEFNQMSELLNQKSLVQGKVPSGYFNAIFELSGAWLNDATDTKYLAFDGYFISLYYLHLTASPLILQDKVKKAVPSNWDPALLSRFIQTYGTHIIVGMGVGGQDVICVRQKPSSSIPTTELKRYFEELGDSWFSDDGRRLSPREVKTRDGKQKVPEIFNRILQSNTMQLSSVTETSSKDGLAIVCSKRGGEPYLHSHHKWLQSVQHNPDAIAFKFVPITSLLSGIPGSGYLSHAINLYLRYKPPPEDLQYFLEFQVPRQWVPMFNELPLGPQRRKASCPALQFSFLGSKLHVSASQAEMVWNAEVADEKDMKYNENVDKADSIMCSAVLLENEEFILDYGLDLSWPSLDIIISNGALSRSALFTQVSSGGKPIIGMRLYLEGKKCNRLAIHVQHLSSLPSMLESSAAGHATTSQWQGSDESGSQYFEPIQWKRYSNVCTSTVKHDPKWLDNDPNVVFVVTGAQIITRGKWPKTVLHMRLLFSRIPNCSIQKTQWATAPASSHKSSFLTNLSTTFTQHEQQPLKQGPNQLNSGVYPDGPPVPVQSQKLLKFVDTAEVVRGPHDAPGHWLVTAAKLTTEGGKIGLHVKFALLNYC
ncbi:hypothetical protein Sjap_005940 [Stephania japonica]|uniref:MACPF domain-containing protein n=1 Tax=Stephania japonica TaxID=461633 RepID=A0AAP0K518_9MAGN